MWLGNPTSYSNYNALSAMMLALMSDYAEWRGQRTFEDTINADDRYSMPAENRGGFKALPLIDARKINEQLKIDIFGNALLLNSIIFLEQQTYVSI